MENMENEVFEAVELSYKLDITLIRDCLFYLYKTTTDDKLAKRILRWFNDNNFCIECGSEMVEYNWKHLHTELDGGEYEDMITMDCPICGGDK